MNIKITAAPLMQLILNNGSQPFVSPVPSSLGFSFMSTPSLHYPRPSLKKVLFFFVSAALGPRFTQPLTEMSTRHIQIIMFLVSKVLRVRRADNLAAIYEPIV
jgi:hypothetical protein